MKTGTRTKTKTVTFTRIDLLIQQINMIVNCTTGSISFKKVIEKGITNKWISTVSIYGLNELDKIRQEIDIFIDWNKFEINIKSLDGNKIEVDIAKNEKDWISKTIGSIIDGFNEITEHGELKPYWTVSYTDEAMKIRNFVDEELGLTTIPKKEWDEGHVDSIAQYSSKKLSEMSVDWKVLTK